MAMPFEIDHVVVLCSADAPEARRLEALGLQGFGGVTVHGDLGTASTSFFFSNLTYLELLFVRDAAQADAVMRPLGLSLTDRMNWRASGQSPFGLMLRRVHANRGDTIPFATVAMEANWMPPGTVVNFNGEEAREPYYGVLPESLTFRSFRAYIPDPPHPLGVRELTGVTIGATAPRLSPTAQMLTSQGLARIEPAAEPAMTLTFDRGAQGKIVDVRPDLPLVLAC